MTVKLTVESDRVVWSDWGWQTNYELGVDRTRLDGIPTMAFERTEYERVLADARQRVAVPSTRRIWSLQPLSEDADPHVAWEVLIEVLAPLATGAITDLFPDPRWHQWDT